MADGSTPVVSLSEFTGVVRRRLRLIVVALVVGGVTGTLLLSFQPQRYVSQAVVEVRPIVSREDDPNLDVSRQIDVDTEVVIARSQRVAERALALRSAADSLGFDDHGSPGVIAAADEVAVDNAVVRAAMTDIEVSVVGDSTILAFKATSHRPEQARNLAQSTAEAYLQFRRLGAEAGSVESRQRLATREAELVAALDALGAPRDTGPDAPATPSLAYAAVSKNQELLAIGSKRANLEALSIDPGVVLTDAALPTSGQGLPLVAGPVTGAMLGLIVALAAALVLDRTDDRLRSSRVELGALGVPLVGNAPVALRGRTGADSHLYPSNTPAGDAYRRLQGSLLFNLDSVGKSVVLLAGVNNPTAATTVAANVGITAARGGRKTLLVGTDLRSNQLAAQFALPSLAGLSDVVAGATSLTDAIQAVPGAENLWVLGAGTQLEDPAAVLRSESMARLLAAVGVDFDLVIVEAAPVLQVADAVDVAPLCHGSVVVVDARNETRSAIADAVNQLRGIGSDVVGVVVAEED